MKPLYRQFFPAVVLLIAAVGSFFLSFQFIRVAERVGGENAQIFFPAAGASIAISAFSGIAGVAWIIVGGIAGAVSSAGALRTVLDAEK